MFDYLIVGCGFAGSTCARLLAEKNKRVLLIDRRRHIAGNAYDEYNQAGILAHAYGPHIFHTRHKAVWDFLSRFTEWYEYQHRVKAFINGMLVPMPINLDTINMLYGTCYTTENVDQFYAGVRSDDGKVENARDMVISKVGQELYELFFKNYTRKQWDVDAQDLDKEVTARIPIRYNRDDRYFSDPYQGMPKYGYTELVRNVLNHPGIKLMLNTDYKEIANEVQYNKVIYTGPIDEFFEYQYGKLPYRSIRFEFDTLDCEFYQSAAVVNYPNDYDYTRITEFKHMTGQRSARTTIVREFPTAEGDPHYPIPKPENRQLYDLYKRQAQGLENVFFLGRLGLYKYANMDVVVKDAMELVQKLDSVSSGSH